MSNVPMANLPAGYTYIIIGATGQSSYLLLRILSHYDMSRVQQRVRSIIGTTVVDDSLILESS